MTAREIMEKLFSLAEPRDFSGSCDTCKAGDPDRVVDRVAVAMFPTPDVVRAAADWGARLLIVHEPTYYNHWDEHHDERVENAKRALIEQSGMTIWRFHDHPHATRPDMIDTGQIRALALPGRTVPPDQVGPTRLILDEPITAAALAERIRDRWGLQHIRLCGDAHTSYGSISFMVGAPNGVLEELQRPDCGIVLVGETREWSIGEYVRDACQLGFSKSLLILGHGGSEREGMVYTADRLSELCPTLSVRYFESGEVYNDTVY